jgi:transposase
VGERVNLTVQLFSSINPFAPRELAMNTNTNPVASTCNILAIDLGKYKSVACQYGVRGEAIEFVSLTTDRERLRKLFAKTQPGVVVIEACLLAGWVYDLCRELGIDCQVANTAAEARKFKHLKRKTDKDDALRLAQLYALGQLPTVVVPDQPTRQWRALIAYRQKLVGRRVALQNRIRAILVAQGLPAPRGPRAWTELGLKGIGQVAHQLAECGSTELWRGLLDLALTELSPVRLLLDQAERRLDEIGKTNESVQILTTMPGLGPRTAEAVAAHLHQPARFTKGKQVSAYGGLVPRPYPSAETDRRGRITRRGPALLRKLLVECAWVLLRYHAWARSVYPRLTHGGQTHTKQAIVALARKLLVRCWARLRDQTPWRGEPALTSASAGS